MDVMQELGALALGSRLKRLSDTLMQDVSRIYRSVGSNFEPRWFPVFVYLYRKGPTSITELARGLGVSHPGINKVANEMIEARLVAPYRDRRDKRKRVIALTSTGREKYAQMEPVWRNIRQAVQSVIDESGADFMSQLAALERSVEKTGFHQRFLAEQARPQPDIEISSFDPRFADAFGELNRAWINRYFTEESADAPALDNPAENIVGKGGDVLFAVDSSGLAVGTCALVKVSDDVAELAKMAVVEDARGKQVGKLLGRAVLERARDMGFSRIVLESNRRLTPAINLYRRLGFVEKPFPHPSDFERADIYMEAELDSVAVEAAVA